MYADQCRGAKPQEPNRVGDLARPVSVDERLVESNVGAPPANSSVDHSKRLCSIGHGRSLLSYFGSAPNLWMRGTFYPADDALYRHECQVASKHGMYSR